MQVSHFEINNSTTNATLENQYRATLTQILGGAAVAIGIYFAWKNFITAQKNLTTAREGQITERFTRAVDQLGNPAIEIRLGGIYAPERISTESEKDYWPIMEILTAYVRKNSSAEIVGNKKATHLAMDIQANESTTSEVQKIKKVTLDTQAILTVLRRRIHSLDNGETISLNLRGTCLQEADLSDTHLEGADLEGADLEGANLWGTHLKGAHLEGAHLEGAYLKGAYLKGTHLEGADLGGAHFEGTNLEGANLKNANLVYAELKGAKNLTIEQLSQVKTLYEAELDERLEAELRAKGYSHLLDVKPEDEP